MSALLQEILPKLRHRLPEQNLYELAEKYGVWIGSGKRLNKGWVGQTIEKVAELESGSQAARDGLDFELKSTTLLWREGHWVPKETIKITQLNPAAILEETFESSLFWSKLARLVFVGCAYERPGVCRAVKINAVQIVDPSLVKEIQAFWEDVQHTIATGEIAYCHNIGTFRDLVQLRPVGTGKELSMCPLTGARFPARAFYATKKLIQRILDA